MHTRKLVTGVSSNEWMNLVNGRYKIEKLSFQLSAANLLGKFLVQMPYIKLIIVTAAAVFFVICEVLYGVFSQCTAGQYSIKNMMLRQHIFKTFKTSSPSQCLRTCEEDVRCQSFNYVISTDVCELNNRTKEARPEHFTASNSRYYFGLIVNRGKEFHRPF